MDLDNADPSFQRFVREDERSTYPSSNALHCEQHYVARALFVTAHRLRRAVAFSNLDQMKNIRRVMCNLLVSLDFLSG